MQMWKLPPPSALVSAIGTYQRGDFTEQQEQLFRRGLRQLLAKTNGWLVTSGTREGLGELVGSAVDGTTTPCIAILPWVATAEHEQLWHRRVYDYGSTSMKATSGP
eukprot:5706009-Prymnesium_polylepis.1